MSQGRCACLLRKRVEADSIPRRLIMQAVDIGLSVALLRFSDLRDVCNSRIFYLPAPLIDLMRRGDDEDDDCGSAGLVCFGLL